MCGRYALGIRASFVRRQLQEQGLSVEDAPPDEEVRESYNFAPGYYGLVYRADVPDHGLRNEDPSEPADHDADTQTDGVDAGLGDEDGSQAPRTPKKPSKKATEQPSPQKQIGNDMDVHYHLKAMKWGLIPFWTKRSPDYGSMMRTINCRDDSLIENRGMWNTMKQRKRCIVVCQGFYEWLKKGPGGKEKIPHFVKRKDGQLMCFAGLWDCAKYEDSEEKLYTYTIITTDSNQQLKFLHDRMPVMLEAGSEAMRTWLDPKRTTWSKELQSLLKPYSGELECYPVIKDVGKVGNNSPDFMVPVDSKENKKNIANFFGNAAKGPLKREAPQVSAEEKHSTLKKESEIKVEHIEGEDRKTTDHEGTEDNAPLPVPKEEASPQKGLKRSRSPESIDRPTKVLRQDESPTKPAPVSAAKPKTRSATSNNTPLKSPAKKPGGGNQRITNFFGK